MGNERTSDKVLGILERIANSNINKLADMRDTRGICSPHLWIIITLFIIGIFIYYIEQTPLSNFPLFKNSYFTGVHDLQRTLFFIPIVYTAIVFRTRGMLIALLAFLVTVLPRAIFYSPYPDPLARALLFVGLAAIIGILVALQLNQLEQLKKTNDELHNAYNKLNKYFLQLKESEELYRSLIELGGKVGEAVVMIQDNDNIKGQQIFVSNKWSDMTGYSKEELSGMTLFEMINPINRQTPFKRQSRKIKGEVIDGLFQLSIIKKDGTEFPAEVASAFSIYNGKKVNVAYIRDITERKEAEKYLEKSEQKYHDLYDNAPVAYFSIGLNGLINSNNKAAQEWLGYSAGEMTGMRFVDIYAEESVVKANYLFNKFQQGETIENEEIVYLKKNGEKVYGILSVNPISDDSGKIVASRSVVQDITERKIMENEVKKHEYYLEELVNERTNELATANEELAILYEREKDCRLVVEEQTLSKINFIRTLVHELKTPLTPIIGTSSILIDRLEDESLLRMVKNVNRGATNLNRRINDLMDFVTGEFDQINLQCLEVEPIKLLTDIVAYITPEAEIRKQHVIVSIKNHLPIIYVDEDRLRQVLLNLLNNALKFTPSDGHVILSGEVQNGKLIITVEDDGCGIDEENKKEIFKNKYNFKINSEKPDSLGLGLPLSKMLIELLGGEIWFESHKGQGSKFSFYLPIVEAPKKNKNKLKVCDK